MRITADPEEDYREFSQSKSVGNGGTFIFNFTKPGRWEYIDDNNPSYGGTIFVYPQAEE
jgi:hypothetical protein